MQMTCPKCMGQMRQYERAGITIDQCSECRGIFLDRGELERLVDAETAWHGGGPAHGAVPHGAVPHGGAYAGGAARPPQGYRDYDSDEYPVYGQPHGSHHGHGQHKRKKRGFLDELFD